MCLIITGTDSAFKTRDLLALLRGRLILATCLARLYLCGANPEFLFRLDRLPVHI